MKHRRSPKAAFAARVAASDARAIQRLWPVLRQLLESPLGRVVPVVKAKRRARPWDLRSAALREARENSATDGARMWPVCELNCSTSRAVSSGAVGHAVMDAGRRTLHVGPAIRTTPRAADLEVNA